MSECCTTGNILTFLKNMCKRCVVAPAARACAKATVAIPQRLPTLCFREDVPMQFDFTTMLDRAGKDALAIDGLGLRGLPGAPKDGFDAIPMWVADMNFATAPSITQAIIERAQHPAFGYFFVSDEYYQAIIDWQRMRNDVEGLTRHDIGYENGVLGGLVSALEAFTSPGDKVLVNSPTYIGFTGSIEGAGRRIERSPLVRDAEGTWRLDFADMERRIVKNHIHLAVFCSPHNPTGRVWERWELEQAAALFAKHRVVVVCDEIWSDLTLDGHKHIPFQQVSDEARRSTIALYAPSKTFNLAGLVGSYHVVYDKYLRDRLVAAGKRTHYNEMNVLSMHALVGAYSQTGAAWVDELRKVLSENAAFACDHIAANYPGVDFARPQGTYMLFLDCEGWCRAHGKTIDELQRVGWDVGVAWQDGRPFAGEWTIRMNLALPTSRVREAFRRLDEHVFVG